MNTQVRTAATTAPRDVHLACHVLETGGNEQVCFLLEIHGKAKDAQVIERECDGILRHGLCETQGDAAERLDGTLKELNGLLKGFLVSNVIDDAHLVVGLIEQNGMLHVSHAGRGEAYLLRDGATSQITEYSSGKAAPAFIHISSGQLEKDDIVVCATQRLLRTITPAQMAKMTAEGGSMLDAILATLKSEKEHASLAMISMQDAPKAAARTTARTSASRLPARRAQPSKSPLAGILSFFENIPLTSILTSVSNGIGAMGKKIPALKSTKKKSSSQWAEKLQDFMQDLRDPKKRQKANMLIIASVLGLFVLIWAGVQLISAGQQSKSSAELQALVEQITQDVQTAENRKLLGDMEAANTILEAAEQRAKDVMENESGLFRMEALDLLDKIRQKREEINNVIRLTPRVVANVAARNGDVLAQGVLGIDDGEFLAYDRQDAYRILLNSVESPLRVSDEELILDGSYFQRFQIPVFMTQQGSVVELQDTGAELMKTDAEQGWVEGVAMASYLRFLYMLAPEQNQIFKYERLNGRYGVPTEYNVSGALDGALDLAIDGDVYVLKPGEVVRLFRGEAQPFTILGLPEDALESATKIFKAERTGFYLLDPDNNRVLVLGDSGVPGEAAYLRQYVLEGEQVTDLKDIYVDPDESRLYIMDTKRLYVIDL